MVVMAIKMIYGVTIFIFKEEIVWHFSMLNDICQSLSHLDRALSHPEGFGYP